MKISPMRSAATRELLSAVIEAIGSIRRCGCVYFTTTVDLNAEFPAIAARQLGWYDVPLICAHEMAVPHGLAKVVRVLIMWNTTRSQHDIQHVYLRDAQQLRPDLSLTLNGRDKSS
jgi:chorismate mutase